MPLSMLWIMPEACLIINTCKGCICVPDFRFLPKVLRLKMPFLLSLPFRAFHVPFFLLLCTGCTILSPGGPLPEPHHKIGKPYEIDGKWYYPAENPEYAQTGIASWYGPGFHGKRTANGEIFNMNLLSAAHRTLPLPSMAEVENLENGRRIIVRINDRGPFAGNRLIDLSRQGARALGFENEGLARVRVRYLEPASLSRTAPEPVSRRKHTRPYKTGTYAHRGNPVTPLPVPAQKEEPAVSASTREPSGPYAVRIAVFARQENLERTKARLSRAGPLYITRIRGENGSVLYGIFMGPLENMQDALSGLENVHREGYTDAYIVRTGDAAGSLRKSG